MTTTLSADDLLTAIDADLSRQYPAGMQTPHSAAQEEPSVITTLSVLIPVYNERWTVAEIVRRVLASPVAIDLEIVAVDDGSTDGSWEILQDLAALEPRLRCFRHARNQGKGAAIRTALRKMTGDAVLIQDADLEYDPRDYPRLLAPLLSGEADAVFGSRFAGSSRRVLRFWHGIINRGLTLMSNMCTDLDLTDMETGYKMVRADVLRQLKLNCNSFTFEPELTCRLAQWGARVHEVPIRYAPRSVLEGKKIRPRDGLKAVWEMLRCRWLDPQFTNLSGRYVQQATAGATAYHRSLLARTAGIAGSTMLQLGAGIGNLAAHLLNRERLVLVEDEPLYFAALRERFAQRRNVQVECQPPGEILRDCAAQGERFETILVTDLGRQTDAPFWSAVSAQLAPDGHCVVIENSCSHTAEQTLRQNLAAAGLEVVESRRFNVWGALLEQWNQCRRGVRELTPGQEIACRRLGACTRRCLDRLPLRGRGLVLSARVR